MTIRATAVQRQPAAVVIAPVAIAVVTPAALRTLFEQDDAAIGNVVEDIPPDALFIVHPGSQLGVPSDLCDLSRDPLQQREVRRRVGLLGSFGTEHQRAPQAAVAADHGNQIVPPLP